MHASPLTDEEDREGDEEQEDVGHHVERVQEAAVVEDASVHIVRRAVLVPAERQRHGGTRTLSTATRKQEDKERESQGERREERGEMLPEHVPLRCLTSTR